MSLLSEIAITPDVLREDGYANAASCSLGLSFLRPILLDEVLVRDLRGGAWSKMVLDGVGNWHRLGKELVRKLHNRGRLIATSPQQNQEPATDLEWAAEAIHSHQKTGLDAIVAGAAVHAQLAQAQAVCCVEKVHASPWWQARSCSIRLRRKTPEYLAALRLVLEHARSLMFIDPHLDPTRRDYGQFGQLLAAAQRSQVPPRIELHRVCYDGSGPSRKLPSSTELRERFAQLGRELEAVGLSAEVFLWDDFHDRYLITNLIGICLLNGFDTSGADERTTWSRLSPKDRDDVQREFDTASAAHALRDRFRIGAGA
jgi:hypothetical protein